MEVRLPNNQKCTLRTTWSELGYGKYTDQSPGVFTLEATRENKASIAEYTNNPMGLDSTSDFIFGKAREDIVAKALPAPIPAPGSNDAVVVPNAIVRRFIASFMETFSLRDFSILNDVIQESLELYAQYMKRPVDVWTKETYQEVMKSAADATPSKLKDMMSASMTSVLYNVRFSRTNIIYQVFTTTSGRTMNIYLRQTQEVGFREIVKHGAVIGKAVANQVAGLVYTYLGWEKPSPLPGIIADIPNYELANDNLISQFIINDVPLEYFSFAAAVFKVIKDDLIAFVEKHKEGEGADIRINGHSLGGGIGCALMCFIGFWKEMHTDDHKLKAKVSSLLVGQIELFTREQSMLINSFMIKHAGRFNLYSVSHAQDWATLSSSTLAYSGGLRIKLKDFAYPAGQRSVHSLAQYIENMDRFYLQMSDISIGERPNDPITLSHVRAFATLPSTVLARGSTQFEKSAIHSFRNPDEGNDHEVSIKKGLQAAKYKSVYFRPSFFYFTDFTINKSTALRLHTTVSEAARTFMQSVIEEFQARLIDGTKSHSSTEIGTIVVPLIERVYIGPSAVYSRLDRRSLLSTWNGCKVYADQYGRFYVRADELDKEIVETNSRKRKRGDGSDPSDSKSFDAGVLETPSRRQKMEVKDDDKMDV